MRQIETLLAALIVSQQELIEALKEQTESNKILTEALFSENEQEEVQPDSYLDGTNLEL